MPIYEYQCSSCCFRFEQRQRFDEQPVAFCPQCTRETRRFINSVPVIFKGSGFYCTDQGSVAANNPVRKNGEAKNEVKSEGDA